MIDQIWQSYRTADNRPKHKDFVVLLSPVLKELNFTTDFHPSFSSSFDCAHPSTIGHAHIATALWNQLFLPSDKKLETAFKLPMDLYCPSKEDVIQVL